jgi:hypothetical protein
MLCFLAVALLAWHLFRSSVASEAAASRGWALVRSRATGPVRPPPFVNAGLKRPLCGNRESSRRPSTRHSPLQWHQGLALERLLKLLLELLLEFLCAAHRTVAMCPGVGLVRGDSRHGGQPCHGTGFAGP